LEVQEPFYKKVPGRRRQKIKKRENMNEQFLNEARRIGDQLLASAKTDEHGTYWDTMSMDMDHNISFEPGEGIYSGVSGIVLFFLELYRQTADQRHLDAAKGGARWAANRCKANDSGNYAFLTGRMGIPYVLLRMQTVTGSGEYIEQALDIAKKATDFLEFPVRVDDLINGTSGTLLGLLHLHAATGEPWLLDAIERFARHLTSSANHGPKGLYWDRSPNAISGLCGFSHGAAGIGFVFNELGRYFQDDTHYKTAEQAFLYERYRYREDWKNWPDLRKGIYTDEDRENHTAAYRKGDMDFFTVPGNMNAWCHGAAGIGLSRLRAYQISGSQTHKDEALAAIEKTTQTDLQTDAPEPTYTLCHGGCGNAELFLYAYQVLKEDRYLEMARTVAQKAIAFYEKNKYYLSGIRFAAKQEDLSLFMGNAGIGYFCLRLLKPHDVPCMLAPTVESTARPDLSLSPGQYPTIAAAPVDIQKLLLEKDFARSLYMAGEFMPGELDAFMKDSPFNGNSDTSLVESYIEFVQGALPSLPTAQKELFSDAFDLELEKRRMDEAVPGDSYLNIKYILANEEAAKIIEDIEAAEDSETAFKQLKLRLEPSVRLFITNWNWDLNKPEKWRENVSRAGQEPGEDDEWAVLLNAQPAGIMEAEISPFSYTILAAMEEPVSVADVITATIDAFESLTPEQEDMLKEKILQQIKQVMLAGIVLKVD
jgi:hypothetical protein